MNIIFSNLFHFNTFESSKASCKRREQVMSAPKELDQNIFDVQLSVQRLKELSNVAHPSVGLRCKATEVMLRRNYIDFLLFYSSRAHTLGTEIRSIASSSHHLRISILEGILTCAVCAFFCNWYFSLSKWCRGTEREIISLHFLLSFAFSAKVTRVNLLEDPKDHH